MLRKCMELGLRRILLLQKNASMAEKELAKAAWRIIRMTMAIPLLPLVEMLGAFDSVVDEC